jgi:hypothetical protein
MEICSVCGKTFKDKRGLAGHMQLSHSDAMPIAGSEIAQLRQAVNALTARFESAFTAKNTNTEGENMEEVMTKKDYEIERLKEELARLKSGSVAVAEAEVEAEAEGEDTPVTKKDLEIERLRGELERANSKAAELPSWFELYEHTKGCRAHSKEFADFREQVLANLSDTEVRELLNQSGRHILPKRIAVPTEGLSPREAKLVSEAITSLLNVITGKS